MVHVSTKNVGVTVQPKNGPFHPQDEGRTCRLSVFSVHVKFSLKSLPHDED